LFGQTNIVTTKNRDAISNGSFVEFGPQLDSTSVPEGDDFGNPEVFLDLN
jgi:hypothetical protein